MFGLDVELSKACLNDLGTTATNGVALAAEQRLVTRLIGRGVHCGWRCKGSAHNGPAPLWRQITTL